LVYGIPIQKIDGYIAVLLIGSAAFYQDLLMDNLLI